MKDLKNNLTVSQVRVDGAAITADTNFTGVDRTGYESVLHAVWVAASGDTLSGSVYISLELEESDDNSTYTDVADADLLDATGNGSGQFALIDDPAEDAAMFTCGYVGSKKYTRVVWNVTGTHTNGTKATAFCILGNPRHAGGAAV